MTLLRSSVLLASILAVSAVTGPVSAHHSFSMFAMDQELVLNGVVTEFQWTNPHTWIELDVADANGVVTHWSIEGGPVSILARQGWKRSTIKAGDRISVVIHPLRSGERGGSLMGVITADGVSLGAPVVSPQKP